MTTTPTTTILTSSSRIKIIKQIVGQLTGEPYQMVAPGQKEHCMFKQSITLIHHLPNPKQPKCKSYGQQTEPNGRIST